MSKKYFIFLLIAILFFSFSVVKAQETATATEDQITQEEITAKDLGISEPRLLPSSPLYFLKNWARGIRMFFTFDPIKKAKLELKYTAEKLIEAKKLTNNKEALKKAINNYETAREKLEKRFQKIKENSQNPNVSQLLDKFIEQNEKHEKVLEGLAEKLNKINREKIKKIRERIEKQTTDLPLRFEAPDQFVKRLNKIVEKTTKHNFKNFEKVIRFNRLINVAKNENLKRKLEKAKELAEDSVKTELETQKPTQEKFKKFIKGLAKTRMISPVLLEELKSKINIPTIQQDLDKAQEEVFEKVMENKDELIERAKESIEKGESILSEVNKKIEETKEKLSVYDQKHIKNLTDLVTKHLELAKENFQNKKYGASYAHANSAIYIAKSTLRYINKRLALPKKDLEKTFTPKPIPVPLFESKAKKVENILKKIREIKKRKIEEKIKENKEENKEEKETEKESRLIRPVDRKIVCPTIYEPVCGKNNITYSNQCFAKLKGVEIAHKGECKIKNMKIPLPQAVSPIAP